MVTIPDYNLGRAHGEIIITSDTSGADRAAAAMAGVSAESAVLNQHLSKTELHQKQLQNQFNAASRNLDQHKAKVTQLGNEYENLRTTWQKLHGESANLAKAFKAQKDAGAGYEELLKIRQKYNQVQVDENKTLAAAQKKWQEYQAALKVIPGDIDKVQLAYARLHTTVDKSVDRMANFKKEIAHTSRELDHLASTLTSVMGTLTKTLAGGAALTAGGGLLGLFGGGTLSGMTTLITGVMEAIQQLSGAALLLPAAVGGAAASLATLAVGFHGVKEAIGSMDDPKKFAEALRYMAPAARDAMTQIRSFTSAFRGAMQEVQQSLFAPIVADIEPLVMTWLPLLMNAGKQIAAVFGEAGHQLAGIFQDPTMINVFGQFINNLTNGIRALMPAMQPIIQAFATLGVVGSTYFPRIADAITNIANRFNNWVQTAAQNGDLNRWIENALHAFANLGHIIMNVFTGINSVFQIANTFGGTFLDRLLQITNAFNTWSKSVAGETVLKNFFGTIREAGQAIRPVLREMGHDFSIIGETLTELGIAMAPGFVEFFQLFGRALDTLAPYLIQSAPALNQLMQILGKFILTVVQQLGPKLPQIFQNFATVLEDLLPMVVAVTGALADFIGSLTPADIEMILGLAAGLKLLAVAAGLVSLAMAANPIVLVIAALAALVVGVAYAYEHSETFRKKVSEVWAAMKEFANWVSTTFTNIWTRVSDAFEDVGTFIGNFGTILRTGMNKLAAEAQDWGKSIIQGLIHGLGSLWNDLVDQVNDIAQIIPDRWKTSSPAKAGPLSQTWPELMGQNISQGFAAGIQSGGSSVSGSADSVAGGVVGSFSSAGIAGTSGGAVGAGKGQSGFESWVNWLTADLSAWSRIFQDGFNLFQNIGDIIVRSVKVVASLWTGDRGIMGDNPLTRPGGLAGRPLTPGERSQRSVPGVPNVGIASDIGKAPYPELTPQGQPGATGVTDPGITRPGVAPPGTTLGGPPGGPVTTNQFPNGPGGAWITPPAPNRQPGPGSAGIGPAGGGVGVGPVGVFPLARGSTDKQAIVNYIMSKAQSLGYSPEQAQWFAIQAAGESGYNPLANGGNQDGSGDVRGIFQFTPGTWGNRPGSMTDAKDNIDAYFELAKQRGLTPQSFTSGTQLGTQVSIGGPWHPQNAAKGHLENAKAVAAPYIAKYQPGPGSAGGPPVIHTSAGDIALTGGQVGLPQAPNGFPQGNKTTYSRQTMEALGIPALFQNPAGGGNPVIPQWVQDFVKANGGPDLVAGSTPHGSLHGVSGGPGWAVDVTGPNEQMDKLAQFLEQNPEAAAMMIHQSLITGETYGIAGGQNVPKGTYFTTPGGTYADEQTMVHWAPSGPPRGPIPQQDQSGLEAGLNAGGQIGINQEPAPIYPGGPPAPKPPIGTTTLPANRPGAGIVAQPGEALDQPLSQERRRQLGIPDSFPPIYPSAPPGPVANVPTVKGSAAPTLQQPGIGQAGGYLPGSALLPQQTDFGAGGNAQSPLDQFSSIMAGAGNIASDVFAVVNDVITNISAAANITKTLARGVSNTEEIVGIIQNIQTFIKTGADIAKTVSDVTGMIGGLVGAGAGADPSGGASGAAAALQAVSAVAGIVSDVLTATNAAISLGIEIYHEVGKYMGILFGFTLGNGPAGMLGGNVKMLLNTRTNELLAFSQDNPLNKNTIKLPSWMSMAYNKSSPAFTSATQLNIYAGPGQTTQQMMSDSMWLINTGAPQTVSVAGKT